jgi:uncharacterized membrane protein (UPF0127 family)
VRRTVAPIVVAVLLATATPLACAEEAAPPGDRAWVAIAGETFTLELALDPSTRMRGLSGRASIARSGGMLFVLPAPRPFTMVMRDCLVPIDAAFLDEAGRVVALHEMPTEPPRRADETRFEYEARLPRYGSGVPVSFAIETAGGRLREVGLRVGDVIAFDAEALRRRAR